MSKIKEFFIEGLKFQLLDYKKKIIVFIILCGVTFGLDFYRNTEIDSYFNLMISLIVALGVRYR